MPLKKPLVQNPKSLLLNSKRIFQTHSNQDLMKIRFTINTDGSYFAVIVFSLFCLFGINNLSAQSCTAPNQCNATPGFPDAPTGHTCLPGWTTRAVFTETFDNGFGAFSEDAVPAGANDLTLSTSGDTPSFGTGPETTAGCNGNANDGEFVFLEGSFTLSGEVHCMSANIPVPAQTASTDTPYNLSFWYYMFGDNIGTLEIFINGMSQFSVSGQQQTANCQTWQHIGAASTLRCTISKTISRQ